MALETQTNRARTRRLRALVRNRVYDRKNGMKPVTVTQYAKIEKITRQGAWYRIRKGYVKAEKIGKYYVIYV